MHNIFKVLSFLITVIQWLVLLMVKEEDTKKLKL